jgi:hypothetical protein
LNFDIVSPPHHCFSAGQANTGLKALALDVRLQASLLFQYVLCFRLPFKVVNYGFSNQFIESLRKLFGATLNACLATR